MPLEVARPGLACAPYGVCICITVVCDALDVAFERAEDGGNSLLATDQPLPTGDELGAEFEQFLAGLDGPDEED